MPKPYSMDLRGRVIEEVESGASRREAAERYGLSPSVVVIWVQRFEETGSIAAKPSGGSTSPLEKHTKFLLAHGNARRLRYHFSREVLVLAPIYARRAEWWRAFGRGQGRALRAPSAPIDPRSAGRAS